MANIKKVRSFPAIGLICAGLTLGPRAWAVDPTFAEYMVGNTGCGDQGQTTFTDVDLDGDWDWLVACKEKSFFFFEFKGKDAAGKPQWAMHKVGDFGGKGSETSGVAMDITGDGYPDHLGGSVWFENPGKNGSTGTWTAHTNNGVDIWGSDAIVGDWNHDGVLDAAFIQKGDPSSWFEIPRENPRGPWIQHTWPGIQTHSGLAAGDMNGDGKLDAVVQGLVYLNLDGKGTQWERVELPYWRPSDADGDMIEVGDVDGDGDMDVVQNKHWEATDNNWAENLDGTGKNWTLHKVGRCAGKGHSANVGDINNDGLMDFELGANETDSYWYINQGNKTYKELLFTKHGTHDMRIGDADQDGDLDMMGKPWGGGDHWYIENLLVDKGGPASDPKTRNRGPMGSHVWTNPNRPKKAGCMIPGDPKYDFWAYHTGDLKTGCSEGVSVVHKAGRASTRAAWTLSLSGDGLSRGVPIYRVDGSRLAEIGSGAPRWEMVVGKMQVEIGGR